MTRADVIVWLRRPGETARRLRELRRRRNDLISTMLPGGIAYDKDRVSSSPTDAMAAFAERVDELDDRIRDAERRYMEEYAEVERQIERLDDAMVRQVMAERYLFGYRFERIAEGLPASLRATYYWHRQGLRDLCIFLQ